MKKNKSWLSGLTVFMLMAMLLSVTAFARDAVDTARRASLTVECAYDGNTLSGVAFDLYKVADVNASGEFKVTDTFSEYSISLEQQSVEGWRALAQTVAAYVLRDNAPVVSQKTTDSSGHASFTELGTGMYLVYGHRYTKEDFVYIPEPFFVSLPNLDSEEKWYYDVEANCKGTGFNDPAKTTTVRVLKVWDDEGHETNRPAETDVQLLRDDSVYDTVTLNAENNWRFEWEGLSADCNWSVIEKTVPENYTLLVAKEGVTFVLTNSYKPAFTTVEALKVWNDKGHENKRPAEIEIQLLRDGQVYDTAVLNGSNNWAHSWSGLEKGRDWSVKEKSLPAGYSAVVTQDGGRFTITNTYAAPVVPKLPKTGQLWWPVPVLISAGLVCYLIGFLLWKARKKRDE